MQCLDTYSSAKFLPSFLIQIYHVATWELERIINILCIV